MCRTIRSATRRHTELKKYYWFSYNKYLASAHLKKQIEFIVRAMEITASYRNLTVDKRTRTTV